MYPKPTFHVDDYQIMCFGLKPKSPDVVPVLRALEDLDNKEDNANVAPNKCNEVACRDGAKITICSLVCNSLFPLLVPTICCLPNL